MSVHEPPMSIKPKPEIPPKPPTNSPPLGERGSNVRRSGGKVKRIVNKFSKQESNEKVEPTANGTAEFKPGKQSKRPPTVKPKPRVNAQLQKAAEQAPPLPVKTSRILKKQKPLVGGEEGDGSSVEGGRSEPDGKEVEVEITGGGEVEVEHSQDSPVSPCCAPSCSCVCHLQRPGMKLMWVSVSMEDIGQEDGGGEDDDSDGVEQRAEDEEECEDAEVECGDEVDGEAGDTGDTSGIEEAELPKQAKAKLKDSLNALFADSHRRRSDPGLHSVLTSLAVTRSESPPIPPKRTQSPQIHHRTAQNEDENIYEATLPAIYPTPEKTAECKEQNIPIIRVRKPACRNRQTSSLSDPTSEFLNDSEPISSPEDVPPVVPPRIPLSKDSRSLTPLHWGSIPLPLPTMEEGRFLQPSSPSGSTATGLSPQRASTPPPQPIQPLRPAPLPPKAEHRRHSSASTQFLTLKKGEENGEDEEEKDDIVEETSNSLRRGIRLIWESRLQDGKADTSNTPRSNYYNPLSKKG